MKKTASILFLLFTLGKISVGQSVEVFKGDTFNIYPGEHTWPDEYTVNAAIFNDSLASGKWISSDENSRFIFEVKCGLRHGTFYYTYKNNNSRAWEIHFSNGKKSGVWKRFNPQYPSRNIKEIPFKNGLIHGNVISYHTNGQISSITEYKEGKKHGRSYGYFEDGRISSSGCYINDLEYGVFKYFKGTKKVAYKKEHYSKGILKKTQYSFGLMAKYSFYQTKRKFCFLRFRKKRAYYSIGELGEIIQFNKNDRFKYINTRGLQNFEGEGTFSILNEQLVLAFDSAVVDSYVKHEIVEIDSIPNDSIRLFFKAVDVKTGETIPFASIILSPANSKIQDTSFSYRTATDSEGRAQLTLPSSGKEMLVRCQSIVSKNIPFRVHTGVSQSITVFFKEEYPRRINNEIYTYTIEKMGNCGMTLKHGDSEYTTEFIRGKLSK